MTGRRAGHPERRAARAAGRALAALGRAGEHADVALVDDREIRALNARYRGVRRRTDVLAFPMDSPLVGQVIVSVETARRQARQLGVPFELELDLLVTHGVLHLVGYDDRDPVEARLMHEREREILGRRAPDRLWTGLLPGPSAASRGSERTPGARDPVSHAKPADLRERKVARAMSAPARRAQQ